ncbi:hypothetical protein NC651_033355 [Populus alba x Populus x berolinensis]|nr:hypothetical protein NC651_033355 [Populus alba x Populus x berolinensis]
MQLIVAHVKRLDRLKFEFPAYYRSSLLSIVVITTVMWGCEMISMVAGSGVEARFWRWWLLGRKEKRMTNGDQITANGGHGGRQNHVCHESLGIIDEEVVVASTSPSLVNYVVAQLEMINLLFLSPLQLGSMEVVGA